MKYLAMFILLLSACSVESSDSGRREDRPEENDRSEEISRNEIASSQSFTALPNEIVALINNSDQLDLYDLIKNGSSELAVSVTAVKDSDVTPLSTMDQLYRPFFYQAGQADDRTVKLSVIANNKVIRYQIGNKVFYLRNAGRRVPEERLALITRDNNGNFSSAIEGQDIYMNTDLAGRFPAVHTPFILLGTYKTMILFVKKGQSATSVANIDGIMAFEFLNP